MTYDARFRYSHLPADAIWLGCAGRFDLYYYPRDDTENGADIGPYWTAGDSGYKVGGGYDHPTQEEIEQGELIVSLFFDTQLP